MLVARWGSRHATRGLQGGFGLIELVITIAIVAILAGIALPSFAYVLRSNRVSTQTNDFLSALNLARNEAITRSRGVTICAADTRSGVPDGCGAATDWKHGWMVFVDDKLVGDPDESIDGTAILRAWVGNEKNELSPELDEVFVRFTARGEARLSSDVTFVLKPSDVCSNQQKRKIVVTRLGRSSATVVDCD